MTGSVIEAVIETVTGAVTGTVIVAGIETDRTVTDFVIGAMIGKMKGLCRGCHRGCDRDWDRNVTKSGTTIRVGTTAPEARPALPQFTAQLAVTAATQQTQAQPGPGICGTTNRLKLPQEESESRVSEVVSHPLCHEFLSVHGEFLSLRSRKYLR